MKAFLALTRVLLVGAVFGLPVCAQTMGEITGRVVDSSGATVPGASVTITNSATNSTREGTSSGVGDYSFPSLPPGVYTVKVQKQGFKTVESTNVRVQVQQPVRLDFTLEVGQISQQVVVEASAAQLQAENATVGTVIDNKR